MKQLTAKEFNKAVNRDPAWASKLTEPVEIREYCNMWDSKITHLSPLLHFTGRTMIGLCASFKGLEGLKVAEGTFCGRVDFSRSGIEKIGHLTITKPSSNGTAALFRYCASLKVAEGTFPGFVDFINSGIEKIGNLTITCPNNEVLPVAADEFDFVGRDGEYLCVEGTPVAENLNELRKLFQKKSLEELKAALQVAQNDHMKLALKSVIARRVMRASTHEIEI